MKANVGSTERTLRILAGLIILILGLIYKSWWGLIGLIPLITGLIKWCPINALFKGSTKQEE